MNGQDDSLGGGSPRMVDKIKAAGFFNGNNRILIDLADSASWDNVGFDIVDLSSVGGYTHFNGQPGSPGTGALLHVGTVGSFDKNTYLESNNAATGQTNNQDAVEPSVTDQSWVVNLHKNNGIGSFAGWFYNPSGQGIFWATSEIFWTNDQGFALAKDGSNILRFWNRSGGTQGARFGNLAVPVNAWNFIAMGIDEAAQNGYVQVNGTQDIVATYTVTDTGVPDGNSHIGVNSQSHQGNGTGWRVNCAFGWDDYMTPTEMLAVYNATKDRFA